MTRPHPFPRTPHEWLKRLSFNPRSKKWLSATGRSALVLGLTAAFNYYLAHVPVPVQVPQEVTAQADHESLVVDNPYLNPNDELLWHSGRRGEALDAYFDDAVFSSETLALFHSLGAKPPQLRGPISYITKSSGNNRNDTCRTSVRARLVGRSGNSTRLTVFQQQLDDTDRHRYLGMKASNIELAIELNTIGPTSEHDPTGSCALALSAGEWTQGLGSSIPITIVVSADSAFRFHFESLIASDSPWGGSEDMFEPFRLSTGGNHLTAEGLHVDAWPPSPAQYPASSRLNIQAVGANSPIRLDHLKVAPGQLQVMPQGKAWVIENGRKTTTDFQHRVADNEILAGLLAALNTWLLHWCWRQFSNLTKRQIGKMASTAAAHPSAAA
jgi:hypothetical protein